MLTFLFLHQPVLCDVLSYISRVQNNKKFLEHRRQHSMVGFTDFTVVKHTKTKQVYKVSVYCPEDRGN